MGSKITKTSGQEQYSFSNYKSYSISEIMAAGGATAFASKLGKDPQKIEARLKKLPADTFLTEEEAASALKVLDESK